MRWTEENTAYLAALDAVNLLRAGLRFVNFIVDRVARNCMLYSR